MKISVKTRSKEGHLPGIWPLLCLINLLITAILGLAMRYKILFPLPQIDQSNLLNAHVNFVFTAWVSLTLFSCLITFLIPRGGLQRTHNYRLPFLLYELASLGMLFSFLLQDYGSLSIGFLFLSVLVACWLIICIWKDLSAPEVPGLLRLFVRTGMLWYLLAIPGSLALVYWAAWGGGKPMIIRASLYWFLHFQYNGWFTFAVFSLLLNVIYVIRFPIPHRGSLIVYWLLVAGMIPGYALSIIAFFPNLLLEISSIFAVLMQFAAAFILLSFVLKGARYIKPRIPKPILILWEIAAASFFVKIVMQAGTLFPSLALFSFSFRPLIIGYLHLTFLCFVTFFLLGYLLFFKQVRLKGSRLAAFGLWGFVSTVILSEIGLFTQSLFAFIGLYPPYFNRFMFWITVGIVFCLLCFVLPQFSKSKQAIVS